MHHAERKQRRLNPSPLCRIVLQSGLAFQPGWGSSPLCGGATATAKTSPHQWQLWRSTPYACLELIQQLQCPGTVNPPTRTLQCHNLPASGSSTRWWQSKPRMLDTNVWLTEDLKSLGTRVPSLDKGSILDKRAFLHHMPCSTRGVLRTG